MPRFHTPEFEVNIKNAYENGVKIKEIIKKFNCTSTYINKIRRKHNLIRNTFDIEELTKKYNIKGKIKEVRENGKKEYRYLIPCVLCNKQNYISTPQINTINKKIVP